MFVSRCCYKSGPLRTVGQLSHDGITISRGSFVFSQSRVKVSASFTNVGSLAVGAFDLVNCSLFVVGFVSVFNISQ